MMPTKKNSLTVSPEIVAAYRTVLEEKVNFLVKELNHGLPADTTQAQFDMVFSAAFKNGALTAVAAYYMTREEIRAEEERILTNKMDKANADKDDGEAHETDASKRKLH